MKTKTETEQVKGSDINVGDVLWVNGYRSHVVEAPRLDTLSDGMKRWYIVVRAEGAARGGKDFTYGSGLRIDLTWTREVK